MKKLILALAVILSVTTAMAQNAKAGKAKATPEQRAQKSADNLDKNVTLSPEQKTQVYNLALSRAQKVDVIRAKYKGQPDQRETAKAEIKAAHKEYRAAVKPLLTPEQIEKLKAKHKERKAAKGGKTVKNQKQAETTITEADVEELIPSEEE